MDTGVALLLASCVWSTVCLVLGLRFFGKKSDSVKILALENRCHTLESKTTTCAAVEQNLADQWAKLKQRLDKLEQPAIKRVQF